jgi:hypothetical protein
VKECILRCGCCPSTAVDAAIQGWWSASRRPARYRTGSHLCSHVRRDVGTLLARSAVEAEPVHVELIRHVGWLIEGEVLVCWLGCGDRK